MPNANYRAGARLERLARAQLEREGYSVMRSAGSKGAWDLIAWKAGGGQVRFIQVKANGATTKASRGKFVGACWKLPAGASGELWERDSSKKNGWYVTAIALVTFLESGNNSSVNVDGYDNWEALDLGAKRDNDH